ncbi:hypothetical protein [Haloarcula ordinaria]|uniref:hypothetical protein n=1 Tax=Haloarcula ordinaria TaxID=3033390 RepID=UPI0023E7F9B6|nr:hypothetical protein [Halomicroarcula sp. ZS-22-S1]
MAYAEEEGIIEEEMSAAGYEYNVQWTFEGPALFASGQTQIAFDVSTIEAARLANQRDMNLTVAAKMMTDNIGMVLPADSEYAPSQTGGQQETLDKIVEDDARIGILGWSAGHIPIDQILMSEIWGKALQPEDGDFNVVEANPGALPELMKEGEIVMAANSPAHGSGEELMSGEFVDLFYGSDEISKRDLGIAPLINTVVTDEFMENHRPAVEAAVRAWNRGTDWFYESGVDDIPGNSTYMEQFGVEDPEVAEYITKWHLTADYKDIPSAYETDTPIYHDDPYIDDEWLAMNEQFMNNAVEVGQAPENWQDLVTYAKL